MTILDKDQALERANGNLMASRYNRDYRDPPIMSAHARDFVQFVNGYIQNNDRVLDLGCGSATLWGLCKELFDPSVQLVGIDLSEEMISEGRMAYPYADFRVGSMLDIPALQGEFDVIIVSSAFHHLNDALLPLALKEIYRALDEHGVLIGREPLRHGRLADRGGSLSAALMMLRHLVYRLTHTREYPEPDPGPDHHAYLARDFLQNIIDTPLTLINITFKNPVSLFFSRCTHPLVHKLAIILDEIIGHKEGQEVLYAARKNYATSKDVLIWIEKELKQNHVANIPEFLAYLNAASVILEREISKEIINNEKKVR